MQCLTGAFYFLTVLYPYPPRPKLTTLLSRRRALVQTMKTFFCLKLDLTNLYTLKCFCLEGLNRKQLYAMSNRCLLFPNCPLLPTSLPVSTPNTIHHSRRIACLPDSLDLTRCLSILFWTCACE